MDNISIVLYQDDIEEAIDHYVKEKIGGINEWEMYPDGISFKIVGSELKFKPKDRLKITIGYVVEKNEL